jgi:hypothetical protein
MTSTSELLQCIESKANWLKQDATSLTDLVSALRIRRDFPTLAEAAMDNAEAELIVALQTVRKARATYNSLPAERDPYIVGESHAA